jgi:hypothetical protein
VAAELAASLEGLSSVSIVSKYLSYCTHVVRTLKYVVQYDPLQKKRKRMLREDDPVSSKQIVDIF